MPIQISDVCKEFQIKRVLNGISASFPTGEVSVIVGQNGSGKSTLLNCVVGLLPFEQGKIEVEIDDVKYDLASENQSEIPIKIRKKIGYIFQHKALWQHLTILDNIIHPLTKIHKKSNTVALDLAKEYLDLIALKPEHYTRYPSELSGGEQRKVAIARTLAMRPDLLFIDELEANLDHTALNLTLDIINKKLIKEKKTIIIVSHNLEMLEEFVPNISILHDGKIIESGKGVNDLLSKECASAEIARVIRESVNSSTSKWFVANRGLETAVSISEINLAEPDLSKLLTQIGKTISKLISSYEPIAQHLLLISTKIAKGKSSNVRIRCAEKTKEFVLDGSEAPTLAPLVDVTDDFWEGQNVYKFKADYIEQLESNHGITLRKKTQAQRHYSLIDRFFDKNGKGISYQYTERHQRIPGAHRIAIPIAAHRTDEKNSYYEFSQRTKNVYLIGCSVDNEVKGVISIDTDSREPWTDFMVQQLVLIGNMVAVAIKNHEVSGSGARRSSS